MGSESKTQSWTALTTRLDMEPTARVVVLGGLPSCPPAVPSTLTSGAKSAMVRPRSSSVTWLFAGKIAFIPLGHLFEIVSLVTFSPSETWQFSLHWSAHSCLSLLGHQDTARPSGQEFYYYLFSQAPGHWTYHLFNSNHKKPLKVILVNGLVTFVILNFWRNTYVRFFNILKVNAFNSLKKLPAIWKRYPVKREMPGEKCQSSVRWHQH